MGKYMRKAKVSGEVAVMEVSHQSFLGVRTRARTLAAAAAQDASLAYLELRSRRLVKPLPPCKDAHKPSPSLKPDTTACSQKSGPRPRTTSGLNTRCLAATAPVETAPDSEELLGENILESDDHDRYVRESTPCSQIRDAEYMKTPCSTNRPSISGAITARTQVAKHNFPTSSDMEELFADAEQLQQKIFIERYNYDPVNDLPLAGRYEWVKVDF
ncbi:cyclin-dependent kinase inhibitor 4-like [Canna indica]|uniref:Cyclin-dependent kinase inhibitor n=1 Tax=Canna indica TaxID=4628 RepID=A0AAQ3K1I0_9LILI|nr:cyclin-dependent kinase inhibitor 4-like [Canna indica]